MIGAMRSTSRDWSQPTGSDTLDLTVSPEDQLVWQTTVRVLLKLDAILSL
jgi:hypothetical protein